ncbi:hypothetical protein ASPFODRAFT_57934 [Aspergillus luchuensis CBS 106.47]|uniref:Uncharacterized protein n=1 Tax=Aspergillus luchuensis (strain CBS 106.47) TaxID=1137211 RepID=A0A1M3TRJ2_ASPLC|nr:hypothetical protein ASPFODRAFT_57934 [Aspergillus luchuensis CBS 106.47]
MWLLRTPWVVQIEDCVLKPAICARRAAAGANSLKPSLVEVPLSWDPQMQVIDGKIRVIRIIAAADMTFRPGRVSNQSVQTKVKISRWEHRSPAPGGVMGGGGGVDTNKSSFGYI